MTEIAPMAPTGKTSALRRPAWLTRSRAAYAVCVILPAIVYAAYLLVIATPVYQSGFRIQIKSPDQNSGASFGQLLGVAGVPSSASDNGYAVVQYLESADAVDDLNRSASLRSRYARASIDMIDRLDAQAPIERVTRYWRKHVVAQFENTTATVAVDVKAYSAEDALALAQASLRLSEGLLNTMSNRARSDTVRNAEGEVLAAENHMREVEKRLYEARSKHEVIDAAKQVSAAIGRVSKLQEQVDQASADVEVRRRYIAPGMPARELAEAKLRAANAALAAAQAGVADAQRPADRTLAGTVSALDELEGEKLFAEKRLQNALTALTSARADAQRQQLYLDTIVRPRLPEEPVFPRPLWNLTVFLILATLAWAGASVLWAAVAEHRKV